MPRENSFSDSDGRSLTPDLSEEEDHDFIGPSSPISTSPTAVAPLSNHDAPGGNVSSTSTTNPGLPTIVSPTPTSDNASSAVTAAGASSTSASASASAPSGLPPTGSPSVLFSNTSALDGEKLMPTVSAPAALTEATRPGLAPADRFRASVRKIIHMKRTSSALSLGRIGAEPGIDPRRASAYLSYGHIKQKCTIEVVDYSSVRSSFGKMENKGFVDFLRDPKACRRESWVKVRWINIGGISWDVISSLAMRFDIHPLALEDVLHQRSGKARSKADYYLQHLFVRILRHTLGSDEEGMETVAPLITRLQRSSSPDGMTDEDELSFKKQDDSFISDDEDRTLAGSKMSKKAVGSMRKAQAYQADLEMGKPTDRGRSRLSTSALRSRRKRAAETMTIEQLKRGERVVVDTVPFFIFLFRDGTVISINQHPSTEFTVPIIARLRQRDTGLRATADPSLLVQSLLDLIVDQALEVVDEYQNKILKLEHEVLIKPKMKTVRSLHILSGDLTLHKRTLEPIKTLVYGLRRYDVDRCAALISSAGESTGASTKVEGFMSHKSKIYLADVHDHIDYIIGSLDMFSSISENLINYTFNMASYEMNEVMRRLTLATIIFLPLTLLTGYFGMNFNVMWSVNNNSDALFWEIALPVMAAVIALFMWQDIIRAFHYVKKRWLARKNEKEMLNSVKKKQ